MHHVGPQHIFAPLRDGIAAMHDRVMEQQRHSFLRPDTNRSIGHQATIVAERGRTAFEIVDVEIGAASKPIASPSRM
jgi:hypothetical protein